MVPLSVRRACVSLGGRKERDMRSSRRWLVLVVAVAGAWLFVSPWILGFSTGGALGAYILGALALLAGLWAFTNAGVRNGMAISAVAGVLAFVMPWVLGFAGHAAARVDAWIVGAVIVVASCWVLLGVGGRRGAVRSKPST